MSTIPDHIGFYRFIILETWGHHACSVEEGGFLPNLGRAFQPGKLAHTIT